MYKDYKYYLSYSIHHNVRVKIHSIELAYIDALFPFNATQSVNTLHQSYNQDTTELSVRGMIYSNGLPMHTTSIRYISLYKSIYIFLFGSTKNRPRCNGKSVAFEEWIVLPILYKELVASSEIILEIVHVDNVYGSIGIKLFEDNGRLKDGIDIVRLKADFDDLVKYDGLCEEMVEVRRLEKLKQEYERKRMVKVGWLDKSSFHEMAEIRRKAELPTLMELGEQFQDRHRGACMWMEFPYFGYPVLLEEELYSNQTLLHQSVQERVVSEDWDPVVFPGMEGEMESLNTSRIWDPEIGLENPAEWKYRKLTKGILRGAIDPNLKPNKEERAKLNEIMANPNDVLRNEERDLLWKFRFTLTDDKRATTKFLLSVDWTDEEEVNQVTQLLKLWSEKAPIEIADALKLLGRQKEFQHDVVRTFAVDGISKAKDNELLDYLLQLVQALRYEQRNRIGTEATSMSNKTSIGPLSRFLILRACQSPNLANYFFWYLKVEQEDPLDGPMFRAVYRSLIQEMKSKPEAKIIYRMLTAQDEIFSQIAQSHSKARDLRARKDQKEDALRKELEKLKWPEGQIIRMPLDPNIQLTGIIAASTKMFKSALYPAVFEFRTLGIEEEEDEVEAPRDFQHAKHSRSMSRMTKLFSRDDNNPTYKVMYKNGDDLRQDQLVMQMFILMDRLLKNVNLDLKLTPYRILAKSTYDGLMEFVLDSCPVSHVVENYETPQILSFLRKHQPDPNGEFGVSREALSNYVKSLAGYCVLTYLLGIGDRHLDNVMMKTKGHIFHIDFGCIFGKDPKPYPPPFKLTKEMVEGMGGISSEHYVKFKTYCCQAYNWLRKSAPLILNLLSLMVDAGIDELSTDPVSTLAKVQEKFRLDLTDEQAEQFFLGLINDSVTALFPVLFEYFHKVATKLR